MPGFAKTTHRLTSFFLYMVLILIVVTSGLKAIDYAKDFRFYNHYLSKWESALTRAFATDMRFPHFSGRNHVHYMDTLIRQMKKNTITIPGSNAKKPYMYQISKTGLSNRQDIFLLCFEKKIILYGLSKTTFNLLDKKIDQQLGKSTGKFKGNLQKDNEHYTGIWEL
jgi:hypothetical protein